MSDLSDHYGGADLLTAIESGLTAMGGSPATATVEQLGAVDEFHVGGRPATVELCEQLGVTADMRVLDVGCGIGGTSRHLAATTGCRVTGIDLHPGFVEVARTLTRWTGLDDRVDFEAGSALDLPHRTSSFDRAVMLHVGMNIADKARLFAEIARVLRPGGRLGIYDLVRRREGEVTLPVPWASDDHHSHLGTEAEYRTALEGAGFEVRSRDRHQFALDFFAAQVRRAKESSGPPPLGLHLIIGPDTPGRLGNLRDAIVEGVLSPVELVATLPPFVPDDFAVPDGLVHAEFRLEPLGPQHNERDHEAWTSSIDHIHATPGFPDGSWPSPMSSEENLSDLVRHADDFARRSGFTYTVLRGDAVIGCVYIYPGDDRSAHADVRSWVRASHAALDAELWRAVSAWLVSDWPFSEIAYAARP